MIEITINEKDGDAGIYEHYFIYHAKSIELIIALLNWLSSFERME